MKKVVLPVIFSALIAGCLAMIGGSNVYAYPSPAELIKKAYDNGVEKCSNDQYFKKNVSLYDVYGLESITNGGGIGTIKNPNPLEDVLSTSGIDCKTLFANHIKVSVPEYSSGNNQAINTALINLGYNGNGATSGGKTCIDISYKNANNTNGKSQPLCITSASNGALNTEEVANANGSFDTSKYDVGIYLGHCGDPLGPASVCLAWKESSGYTQVESIGNRTTPYTTLAEIQADIEKAANRLSMATQTGASDIGLFSNVTVNAPTTERGDGSYESYTYGSNPETNAGLILENFSNYSSWPAAAFTPYEKYWYYMYTLLDFYKVSIDEQSCDTVKSSSNPRAIPMHNQNGGRRWCNVTGARENGDMLVNMFSDDHFLDKEGGLDDVIAAIRSLDINNEFPDEELASISETTGEVTDPNPNQSEDAGGSTDPNDVCYGADGTLGMSWLVCPIATGLYDTLGSVYDVVENNFLKLDGPQLLGSDTRSVWNIFQTIANIVFVIFLLVVIFSQLTGFGIDNYGIKKILPKLIICAILINLSFLIVQAAVDVSNIIGVSARNVFSNITPEVTHGATDASGAAVATTAIVGLGITIGAFVWNPALLLSFLLGLLSCVVSVITLWVILMAREVGVVIIAILAPLAFACYLLPNTSRWLKSWWNVLKALLLLYPLAALLVGGSAFVSAIIANTANGDPETTGGRIANNLMMLGAMLVRFLPFLMLPTLFKKSLDAVGKLGTTIQGLGRNLTSGARKSIAGTNLYKDTSLRLSSGVKVDKEGNVKQTWGGLIRRKLPGVNRLTYRRDARSSAAYLKNQAEIDQARQLNAQDYAQARVINQQSALEDEQAKTQASLLRAGRMLDATTGRPIDYNDKTAVRNALVAEAHKDTKDQNMGRLRALYDQLRSIGDDGIDEIANAWDSGQFNTASRGFEWIRDTIANDGEIKSKARSLHALANEVKDPTNSTVYDTTGGQVGAARATGRYTSKVKPEMLASMTDGERDDYIAYALAHSDPRTATYNPEIARVVYTASSSNAVMGKLKDKEAKDVYNIADSYVQTHTELARPGTYTTKSGTEVRVRKLADGRLVDADNPAHEFVYRDSTGKLVNEFLDNDMRLKRD
ncbi:hypothetical protein IKG73_02830 [Candidatus Saccharibacteria bacterium]|nr:hypothetical protein [Candidatus Saccharibacteria bacterium]